jgi:hypothetical protein
MRKRGYVRDMLREMMENIESGRDDLGDETTDEVLAEKFIKLDDDIASMLSKKDLAFLEKRFRDTSEQLHDDMNATADILRDYEDDNGREPTIQEFYGKEWHRKIFDFASFLESFSATIGDYARKAKK